MDTADPIVTHTTFKTNLSVSCAVVSFIFQHEQTCQKIFRYIGKRETNATSLHGNDCKDN